MHFPTEFSLVYHLQDKISKIRTRIQQCMYQTKLVLRLKKIMKLMYTLLNVSFLKTLVTSFHFLKIFEHQERKVTPLFQSQLKISCFYFFINIFKKKLRIFWFIKQNQNTMHLSSASVYSFIVNHVSKETKYLAQPQVAVQVQIKVVKKWLIKFRPPYIIPGSEPLE